MKAQCTAATGTYLRGLLVLLITLMASVGKTPLEFSSSDWTLIFNGFWAALVPVLLRALSKEDTHYGRSAEKN